MLRFYERSLKKGKPFYAKASKGKEENAMTMPVDLVLIRHGQSEGNVANKLSREGDDSAFTDEFKARHSSQWRLTRKGREQAISAREWLRANFKYGFGRYYVSEYVRALETAALLDLPEAIWYREFYLRERDWGQLDVMSNEERMTNHREEMKRRERDGFFWAPPGGESMSDLCLRVDRIIHTLHRECSDMKVVIVCHGEVMWAFRVRLERMTQKQYRELDASDDSFDRIHNCQIFHYTRRELDEQINSKYASYAYFRSICPTDTSLSRNKWQSITRPRNTNEELLAEVRKIPQLVDSK